MEQSGHAGDLEAVQNDMPQLKTRFEVLKEAIETVLISWEDDESV